MDEIMPLYSSRHPYGMTAGEVQAAGCMLLLGVRQWIESCRPARTTGTAVMLRGVIVRLAGRHPVLTVDARLAGPRPDDGATGAWDHLAAKVFRDTLLSVPGSEFVLGPPDGPGALLLRAWLFLSGREASPLDQSHLPEAGPAH